MATPLDAYSIFQSAPLSRGETKSIIGRDDAEHISIRSPHARGDLCRLRKWGIKIYFNPLPSHEGRPAHAAPAAKHEEISIHSPHTRGDADSYTIHSDPVLFQSTPLIRGETLVWDKLTSRPQFQSTPLMRGETGYQRDVNIVIKFQSTPLIRGETRAILRVSQLAAISIRSPHARGDSISLQKSVQIYVSLHNKTMIHRFSELYKPLFAAQSPIFGVRSPRKTTTASPSHGLPMGAVSLHDLAGYALRQMIGIDVELIILKAARHGDFGLALNIHELKQLPRGGVA